MMNDYAMNAGERASVQIPLGERMITTELTGDFSLPDYQPEIKRLLRIEVGVLPPTATLGTGTGELEGTLDYYVLYMGHDNALWCAPLSTEYRMDLPIDSAGESISVGEPIVCVADVCPDLPTGRVTAPRRLSIRCKLTAKVKLYGECLLGADMDPPSEQDGQANGTEYLTGKQDVSRLYCGLGDLLPLQDDIILTPSESGEWRVVCAEGSVMMTEAMPAEGIVNCRGEVTVKLSLCPAETEEEFASDTPARRSAPALTVMQRKIPFSQAIEMEGVTSAATACARGYCTDLSVQMEEGHVHLDLGVLTEVRAQKNETVTYVKDLYSTRREGTTRHALHPTEYALRSLNGNMTLSDSLSLSEIISEAGTDVRVVDVTALATPETLTADTERGRCILTGTCRAHLLLMRDGEYTGTDMTLPFRYEFDAQNTAPLSTPAENGRNLPMVIPALAFDGSVDVLHCRARTDSERIALDAELAISLRIHTNAPLTALSEVSLGDEVTRRRGEYIICFPAPTDSLWSVAKRYHAPIAALTAANNLSAGAAPDTQESLEGVGYLIV